VVDVGSYGSWYPVQEMSYYPFGMSHPFVNQYPERQNFKFGDKELDEMHGLKRSDHHARQLSSVLGIWTQPDPLAEKYYSTSPYTYTLNNPIRFVDPDGMAVYIMFGDGRMVLAIADQTDEDFKKADQVYRFRDDASSEVKSTTINDKNLLPQLAGLGAQSGSAMTSSSTDAFNFFKFAADNSTSEWSLGGYKNSAGSTDYVLNTNFDKREVKLNTMGKDRVDMTFHIHSHPHGGAEASGYDLYFNNLKLDATDATFMSAQFNRAKEANKQWPSGYPQLFIYHIGTGGLYNYNHKSSSVPVGRVTTPASMSKLVRSYKFQP
jgi:RHS repeat-associated protein